MVAGPSGITCLTGVIAFLWKFTPWKWLIYTRYTILTSTLIPSTFDGNYRNMRKPRSGLGVYTTVAGADLEQLFSLDSNTTLNIGLIEPVVEILSVSLHFNF